MNQPGENLMTSNASNGQAQEVELKLALPTSDPSGLARRLSRTPVLARRQATQLGLHNIYYDTPEQMLRQQRIALRLRRVGSDTKTHWLQTLKTGGLGDSALSQRGEWEAPVRGARLSLPALKATPWPMIDPGGLVFPALAPCFATTFKRTRWLVRRRDGSVIEVALDIGEIVVGDQRAPLCELELELRSGQPSALFELARLIAQTVPVLPLHRSKAERGYALAQNLLDQPLRAQPPALSPELPLPEVARRVLGEMFCQFTANLDTLRVSDHPEVVHQARVGWRRFRSGWRLFRSHLEPDPAPSWQALQALLDLLGELRDLDVARTETLPTLADAYATGDSARAQQWQGMLQALGESAEVHLKAVRRALEEPDVGLALLATTQWLRGLSASTEPEGASTTLGESPSHWARRRMARLDEQLQRALKDAGNPERQHRARILAKRLRYGAEALRDLLPARRARRWLQRATELQTSMGAARDVMQAAVLVARLGMGAGLTEFLRGVALGQERAGSPFAPVRPK